MKKVFLLLLLSLLLPNLAFSSGKWISPTGHNPSGAWTHPSRAYDGENGTFSQNDYEPPGWGSYLELTYETVIKTDKVGFYAYNTAVFNNEIDIDVYYGNAWHNVYKGDYPDRLWTEKLILDGKKSITKARMRIYSRDVSGVRQRAFNEFALLQASLSLFDIEIDMSFLVNIKQIFGTLTPVIIVIISLVFLFLAIRKIIVLLEKRKGGRG